MINAMAKICFHPKSRVRTGLRSVRAEFHRRYAASWTNVYVERGVFSFTFDDIPKSTVTHGVPLLNELGLKGTFYIASQLATGRQLPSLDEQFASLDDVLRLQKMGHEIGCHTFTHYKLRNGSANELAWDACRNRQMLLDSGVHVKNFAYPYGQVTASAKAKLKPHYETLRSTYQGINEGKVDLGCLSVFNLYSETLDRDMVSKIVRETVRKNAWTIFYTHGVEEFPNRYGSTQDDLKWAIDTCQNAGAQVLSISDALDRIRKS